MSEDRTDTTIVVPTLGRPSLKVLLDALAAQTEPVECPILLVDDRRSGSELQIDTPLDVRVLRSGGGGPARARNIGWRSARTTWVSFLDDDVVPDDTWYADLRADLEAVATDPALDVAGTQGRLTVPLPTDRRATDWERGTAGLETSSWITADLTYRREELAAAGGFDERFPRAFREDADLALRLGADRGRIPKGQRHVTHPVRPADDWASARAQAGNADDVLMTYLHGIDWHRRANAPVGRRWAHVAITAAGVTAAAGLVTRRPRMAAAGAVGWLAGTGELAWRRIAPGPRDPDEVRRMVATSAVIPALATWHTLDGVRRHRRVQPWRGLPELVLLDRDGTLVEDVPYNSDPELVRPVPGARDALDRLRREGVRLVVVTNQSGIGRGMLTEDDADRVDARVAELLGPFEAVYRCPHAPQAGCECRKPAPGLVKQALADTGVHPDRAVMIGDIGADVGAATAAGVSSILVPTPVTRAEEVEAAPRRAGSLPAAVDLILGGAW